MPNKLGRQSRGKGYHGDRARQRADQLIREQQAKDKDNQEMRDLLRHQDKAYGRAGNKTKSHKRIRLIVALREALSRGAKPKSEEG